MYVCAYPSVYCECTDAYGGQKDAMAAVADGSWMQELSSGSQRVLLTPEPLPQPQCKIKILAKGVRVWGYRMGVRVGVRRWGEWGR